LAKSLKSKLLWADIEVLTAYNEFCAPSVEHACEVAVDAGATEITTISTMFSRGGVHSETEIPEIVARLQKRHPGVAIRNVLPFDLDAVSNFLAGEVKRVEGVGMRDI